MHPHPRQNTTFSGLSRDFEALLAASYRFSFNGQERDDEVSGEGNSLSFKYRVEDSRLGRFFSVDPLFYGYPAITSYGFAENRPIDGIDFEGKEWRKDKVRFYVSQFGDIYSIQQYTVTIKVLNSTNVDPKEIQNICRTAKKIIERAFNSESSEKGLHSNIKVKVNFVFVEKEEDIDRTNDFYMEFVPKIADEDGNVIEGVSSSSRGYTNETGNTQQNRMQIRIDSDIPSYELVRTIAHELGHTAGLEHPDNTTKEKFDSNMKNGIDNSNLMNETDIVLPINKPAINLTRSQMKEVDKNVKEQVE